MKNYKAYFIISALTDDELSLFESFLKSPYHNTRKKPLELFQLIKKNKSKPEATKQRIFGKLYPDRQFNSNTFNDLMAQLHKLAEEFLSAEINKTDVVKKDVALLDKYLQGRFKGLFENKKKQLDKFMQENEKLDSFFFWHSFLKDAYELNYIQTYKNIKTSKDFQKIINLIYSTSTSLLNLCLEDVMTLYIQAETRKQFIKDNGCFDFINNITSHLFSLEVINSLKPHNKYQYNVEIMKNLLNIFREPYNAEFYFSYKKALVKFSSNMTKDQLTFHYTYLIGFCVRKIRYNKKDSVFIRELNLLFKKILKDKLYASDKVKYFRPRLYNNFLDAFVFTENIKAIQYMLKTCLPLLEKRFIPYYRDMSNSYIYFISRNYAKALEVITNLAAYYKDSNASLKVYIIKINFHLKNTETVLSLLDSYTKNLKSTNIDLEFNHQRMNFIKFTKKMTLLYNKGDWKELNFLYKKISEEKNIRHKNWLLETLEEILKGKKF